MLDFLVYVPKMPRSVTDYLMPNEDVVVGVRMHPLVILLPVILTVAGIFVVLAVTTGTGSSRLHALIWIPWAVLFLWASWKVTDWRLTYFVITVNRLMLVTGVFDRSIGMMPLTKVTDMRLDRTPMGRALGYGEFIIESAGQEQALRNIRFVPYPRELYQQILAMIFPQQSPPPGPGGGDPGF